MHMAGNYTHIKYILALVASTVFKQKGSVAVLDLNRYYEVELGR